MMLLALLFQYAPIAVVLIFIVAYDLLDAYVMLT